MLLRSSPRRAPEEGACRDLRQRLTAHAGPQRICEQGTVSSARPFIPTGPIFVQAPKFFHDHLAVPFLRFQSDRALPHRAAVTCGSLSSCLFWPSCLLRPSRPAPRHCPPCARDFPLLCGAQPPVSAPRSSKRPCLPRGRRASFVSFCGTPSSRVLQCLVTCRGLAVRGWVLSCEGSQFSPGFPVVGVWGVGLSVRSG